MFKHLQVDGADQVRLHAVTIGERGSLMLFLHGFPEFWQAWHRQLPEFGCEHRAVAVDLRGYNRSDKPVGVPNYELPRIVDDIRHIIRALSSNEPAILVGHDWGGVAAWVLARESPELIGRLVIINAPHPMIFHRELKENGAQRVASSYAAFFQLRGVAEVALKAFDYAALRRMVFGTSAKPEMFPHDLRVAYRHAWSEPGALSAGLNYYRNLRAFRRMLQANQPWRIEVPTLVLWGERDPALLTGNLDGLENFVPRLTVFRHPTATHWIVHEEPEWVNARIREFLGS